MGQVESAMASDPSPPPSSSAFAASAAATTTINANNSQPPALDSLIAEAAAYGNKDEYESPEAKAERALDCPCIAHLRSGECGAQFSQAFLCFLKSTSQEKGSDCVHPFVALQSCIKANPNAFSKDNIEGDIVNTGEDKPAKGYRIIPPSWSVNSKPRKPKL